MNLIVLLVILTSVVVVVEGGWVTPTKLELFVSPLGDDVPTCGMTLDTACRSLVYTTSAPRFNSSVVWVTVDDGHYYTDPTANAYHAEVIFDALPYAGQSLLSVRSRNGSAKTIIDCNASTSADEAYAFIILAVDPRINVSVTGFTITRCTPQFGFGGAMFVALIASFYCDDIVMDSNFGIAGAGSFLAESSSITITNSVIKNGYIIPGGAAGDSDLGSFGLISTGNLTMTNVTFYNNTALTGAAMVVSGAITATLTNVTFTNNIAISGPTSPDVSAFGAGIVMAGDSLVYLYDCLFSNNQVLPAVQGFGGGAALVAFDTSEYHCYNVVFDSNSAYAVSRSVVQGGAVMSLTDGVVTFESCSFINNTSVSADSTSATGGAIYFGTSTGNGVDTLRIISNSLFLDNYCSFNGGAIAGPDPMNLLDNNFTNNIAVESGGAYLGVDINAYSNQFYYNTAQEGSGGAMEISGQSLSVLYANEFVGNTAATDGGGVAMGMALGIGGVNVTDCIFTSNHATLAGGGLYLNIKLPFIDAGFLVSACTFTSNTAQTGGGFYVAGCSGNVCNITDQTLFVSNVAYQNGGGLFLDQSSYGLIDEGTCFYSNVASNGGGGAIALDGASATVLLDGIVDGNSALQNGGGIFSQLNCDVSVGFSNITNNRVTGNGDGGGVFSTFADLYLTNVLFMGNSAVNGGAVAAVNVPDVVIAYNFNSQTNNYVNNTATNSGGAIYLSNCVGQVVDDYIANNTAQTGLAGGLGLSQGDLYVQGTSILMNTAGQSGGGFGCQLSGLTIFISSTVSNNVANQDGGGMHFDSCGSVIQASTISYNQAVTGNGGGIYTINDLPTSSNFDPNRGLQLSLACHVTNNRAGSGGGGIYLAGVTDGPCPASMGCYWLDKGGGGSRNVNLYVLNGTDFCNNIALWSGSNLFHAMYRPTGLDSSATSTFCNPDYNVDFAYGSRPPVIANVVATTNTTVAIPQAIISHIGGKGVASMPYELTVETVSDSPVQSDQVYTSSNAPLLFIVDVYGQLSNYPAGANVQVNVGNAVNDPTAASGRNVGQNTVVMVDGEGSLVYMGISGTPTATYDLQFVVVVPYEDSTGVVLPPANLLVQLGACAPGYQTPANNVGCYACAVGYYNRVGGQACLACPKGAVCLGTDQISAATGFWYDERTDSFYVCPHDYCLNGGCKANQVGPLCSQCAPGFTRWGLGCLDCSSNSKKTSAAIFWVCATMVAMLFVHYLVNTNKHGSALLSIGTFFVQSVPLLISDRSTTESGSGDKFVSPILGPFNFNIEVFSTTCINQVTYYDKYLVVIFIPFILVTLTLIHFLARAVYLRGMPDRLSYMRCCVSIGKFMYAPIARQAFEIFACDNSVPGYSFLIADYSVLCTGATYQSYVVLSILIIVIYVIPLPFMLLTFIHRIWTERDKNRMEIWGFLFKHFKDGLYWYEFVMTIRRSMLAALFVAFSFNLDLRSLILCYFLILMLIIHFSFVPFVVRKENNLETLSLTMLVFLSASYASSWLVDSADLAPLVLVLTLPPLATILWLLLSTQFETVGRTLRRRTTTTANLNNVEMQEISR